MITPSLSPSALPLFLPPSLPTSLPSYFPSFLPPSFPPTPSSSDPSSVSASHYIYPVFLIISHSSLLVYTPLPPRFRSPLFFYPFSHSHLGAHRWLYLHILSFFFLSVFSYFVLCHQSPVPSICVFPNHLPLFLCQFYCNPLSNFGLPCLHFLSTFCMGIDLLSWPVLHLPFFLHDQPMYTSPISL